MSYCQINNIPHLVCLLFCYSSFVVFKHLIFSISSCSKLLVAYVGCFILFIVLYNIRQ